MEKRQLEIQLTDIEVRSEEGKPPVFRGYAVVFNADGQVHTRSGSFIERILPGAFQQSLQTDRDIFALLDHDINKPLGRRANGTLQLSEDERGIRVEITPPNTTYANDTMELVKRGDKVGMSFGFTVPAKGDKWKSDKGKRVREVAQAELHEVSIVTVGAYQAAYVEARNEAAPKKVKEPAPAKENTTKATRIAKQELRNMTWTEIKKLEEQRAALFAKAAEIRDGAKAEENRDLTDEENEQHDAALVEAEKLTPLIDREKRSYLLSEKMNTRVNVFETMNPSKMSKDEVTEKRAGAFDKYLRRGMGFLTSEEQGMLQRMDVSGLSYGDDETRDLTVGGIGVVGPRDFSSEIIKVLKDYTGVREAGATVITTGNGNPFTYAVGDDTTNVGELVGEGVAVTSANPTITNLVMNAYKYSSKVVKVSLELLQDEAFDLQSYIASESGARIGRLLNTHTTTGDNTNKPNGIANLAAGRFVSAAAGAVDYDKLISVIHTVDPAYRRNREELSWMMNDATFAAVRKIKDTTGRPIFEASLAGEPDRVLGYRVVVNNDVPAIAGTAALKFLYFGNFKKYIMRDVVPASVLRLNELYAESGLVGFVTFSRHDGEIADGNAFAGLKNA